jgi:hypothetical protein
VYNVNLQSVAPADWNHDDVGAWAVSLGLPALARGLRNNGVDGQLLLSLSEKDVRKDLAIANDLQIRKIMSAIEKLRTGDNLPPSASRQGLLQQDLKSPGHTTGGAGALASLPQKNAGEYNRTITLYRIWQSMSKDAPFMTLHVDSSKNYDQHIEIVRAEVLRREGATSGTSAHRRKNEGHAGGSGMVLLTLKQRNGVSVDTLDMLQKLFPGGAAYAEAALFVLVEHELFFFPADQQGEKFTVPLPSAQRSVQVHTDIFMFKYIQCKLTAPLPSSHDCLQLEEQSPRRMLVANFLASAVVNMR